MAADFTIAEFLAWARTKPANETYCFSNPDRCALAQFGRASGREYLVGVGDVYQFVGYGKALSALVRSDTFGELVAALECIVEPRFLNRVWARLTGKTIGPAIWSIIPSPPSITPSDTWTKANAYLADIEQVTA
jgi:hypothetical protein